MDNAKKKKLLVIVGILIVVVAASIVLYVVIKNSNQVPSNKQAELGSDFVEVKKQDSLNVDRVSTKAQITQALGEQGSQVNGPETTAVLRLGEHLSQTATYTFTMTNGKKASFYVDARTYPDKKSIDEVDPLGTNTEPTKVDGVGDAARWLKKADPVMQLGDPYDSLMVVKGLTSFAFQIEQPRADVAIDKQTARDIILEVAKSAKLEAVK